MGRVRLKIRELAEDKGWTLHYDGRSPRESITTRLKAMLDAMTA